jgi:hypothetical protein
MELGADFPVVSFCGIHFKYFGAVSAEEKRFVSMAGIQYSHTHYIFVQSLFDSMQSFTMTSVPCFSATARSMQVRLLSATR